MRLFSLAGGLAALATATARYVLSADGLERLVTQMPIAEDTVFLTATWHALTIAMAISGAAMIWTSRATAGIEAARLAAITVAAIFGSAAALLAWKGTALMGSPLAVMPVIPTSVTALLAVIAAFRAR